MENKNLSAFVGQSPGGAQVGLTKREYAAIAIMAGYAGSPASNLAEVGTETRAIWAVIEADALLKELAK